MNVKAVVSDSISKTGIQNSVKSNKNLNTSFDFKGVNSKNLLNAMDAQSLSSKAQVSFGKNDKYIYMVQVN